MPEGGGVGPQPSGTPSPPATNPPTIDLTGINLGTVGGGGSSSGGGSAAPVDPTVSAATSFYFQLWGVKPPANYIESFLNGQHDLFDFITFQLSRPGADNQIFYRDRFSSYAAQAASIMGTRS